MSCAGVDDDWYGTEDDEDEDFFDDSDEPPLFGCACRGALCITTVCPACIETLKEQEREAAEAEGREVPPCALDGPQCADPNATQEADTMVRAKFECTKNDGGNISLQAVHSGSDENKQFFQHTPNGQITMSVVNPPAAQQFVVGKQYYADFSEAGEAGQQP
jgi:hypothetical protein